MSNANMPFAKTGAPPFGAKMYPPKTGKSKGSATQPGTQPKVGKTPQPARASKVDAGAMAQGFTRAKKIGRAGANVKHKEIVPRAKITTRATPKAEY